jgi:hypothetical protein
LIVVRGAKAVAQAQAGRLKTSPSPQRGAGAPDIPRSGRRNTLAADQKAEIDEWWPVSKPAGIKAQ